MQNNQNNNSFIDFFDRLASFDTETTGINTKVDRIWQTGFTKKGIDTEEVVNPFFVQDSSKKWIEENIPESNFTERLRKVNGKFSEEAYNAGHFNTLIDNHKNNNLFSLNMALDNTLVNLSRGDVLVLQNHNFENRLIQQGFNDGIISDNTYNRIKDKMAYASEDSSGNTRGILQTPTEAAKNTRRALFSYNSEYLGDSINKKQNFEKYTRLLNKSIDAYKEEIKKKQSVIVVEQMDVTRALYANAIQNGLMDSRHAQIGLSIDFLTKTLLDRAEAHTALSDSKDTVKMFETTWTMLEELRTNNISDTTRENLAKLNKAQYGEAHYQFLKSVDSVIHDFKTDGYSRYSQAGSAFIPETHIRDLETGQLNFLKGKSSSGSNQNKGKIYDINTALDNVLSRYSDHDNKELREKYVKTVKDRLNESSFDTVGIFTEKTKNEFQAKDLPTSKGVHVNPSWWDEKTMFLGREMKNKTKGGIIGGALLGLGYMMAKGSPQKQDSNSYVSEQFYDEQYLGTQFVNFNERNKHYMY